jgi:hypothetical protein
MTDAEFLHALESCVLPASEFTHSAHVRAAYLYLRQGDFTDALVRMRTTILNYARHLGKPNLYHETITVAYVALIRQHMEERGSADSWPEFARCNPELLRPDLLKHFYTPELLASDTARKVFVLPRSIPTLDATVK